MDHQDEILATLEAVSVGQEVAEHETELPHVFIADIEVYRRLINDEVDLITGGKGSGKSAIYRMITETTIAEGLEVIPGSNPTGAPEFQALFTGNDSEERLRSIWAVYFAGIVGNYVSDTYADVPGTASDVSEVRELLEAMGLRRRKKSSGLTLLQRIRTATSVEGNLRAGAVGLEVGGGLRFDLPTDQDKTGGPLILDYHDFFSVLKKCADIMAHHNARVWIALDRLDECFTRNSESERRALRALLRSVLDCSQALQYTPWIRIKVFLRTDMFVKFTEDGAFTNATHLRRNDISWTFNSMADLIAHRLIKSEGFSERYLGQTPGLSNTRAAWDALLPPVGRAASSHAKKRFSNSQQICLWTADGSGLYNPRNAITLLNLALLRARENQRRAISLGSANRPQSPLVSSGEVQAALGELARRRIEDTVQNEFPSVAPLINMLVGGPNEYKTRKDLLDRLGLDRDGAKAEDALNSLVMSGLIGQKPGVAYYIPRLYRPALRSKSRGGRVGDPG